MHTYLVHDGKSEKGPFNGKQLVSMSRDGSLLPTDKVRAVDRDKWTFARNIRGLAFPENDESVRLRDSYLALSSSIHRALTDPSTDPVRKKIAYQFISEKCCDHNIGDKIQHEADENSLIYVQMAVGHDLLYWSIIAILADGKVQKEELESIAELIKAISLSYTSHIPKYASFSPHDVAQVEQFLAQFKKDRSHYGWPTEGANREISIDAMLGAPLAVAATLASPQSECLRAYKKAVETCIAVIMQIGSYTIEEQAITARAKRFLEHLEQTVSDTRNASEQAVSPLSETVQTASRLEKRVESGTKHFRQVSWGMTRDEVKGAEVASLISEESNSLIYEGSVAGLDAFIIYVFSAGVCIRAKYALHVEHSNENHHLIDYSTIREILIKKYGPCEGKDGFSDDMLWMNDLFQDEPEQWGLAISSGHLLLMSSWATDDTEISLILRGDNYDIIHAVEYSSRELAHLEDIEKESQYYNEL